MRRPEDWRVPDVTQATVHAVLVGAIYDGIARAARDWLVDFLKSRVPSSLGAPLATLPRAQEIVGGIEARLAVNARLIDSFAGDFDDGVALSAVGVQHHQAHRHQQRGRGRRGRAVADQQSRADPRQSAGAALSRRAVRPRAHAAGRRHAHRRRPPRAWHSDNINENWRQPCPSSSSDIITNNNSSETIVRNGPVLDRRSYRDGREGA